MWTDTIRREKELARKGSAVHRVRRFGRRRRRAFRPVADARRRSRSLQGNRTGLDRDRRQSRSARPASRSPAPRPASPIRGGVPCTTYIGPNGAGHYVKMVHNGIEYGDMQMICEAYWLLRNLLGLSAAECADVFRRMESAACSIPSSSRSPPTFCSRRIRRRASRSST